MNHADSMLLRFSKRTLNRFCSLLALSALLCASAMAVDLKAASSFDGIADKSERSRALFIEAGKVIQHPRCQNCHPKGDRPAQGVNGALHVPLVVRGVDGHGAPGMRCATCHQAANFAPSGVPGNPSWHLAKSTMGWQTQSLAQICAQIKDRKLNGDRSLTQIHDHVAQDSLVGWAWAPGAQREPAPGSQAAFGQLIEAWIATGAECPKR